MSKTPSDADLLHELRLRAHSRLTGQKAPPKGLLTASSALGILHELASSASTAPDALALLHELQVHQIELDLQAEDLCASRFELEQSLTRQRQIHDSLPVACFIVSPDTRILEANLTAAQMLGMDRDLMLGQPLVGFLSPASALAVQQQLQQVHRGAEHLPGIWVSMAATPAVWSHCAAVSRDWLGPDSLVTFMPMPQAPVSGPP